MDSIENGATIRIGLEKCDVFDWENERNLIFFVQTYSLKINKKTYFSSKGGTNQHFEDLFINATEEIARIMKEKNVKNYVIYNGEMIETPKNQWAYCKKFPIYIKEAFEGLLEKELLKN